MIKRSTLQLLRFHFSLFLLPVFLFAISLIPDINWKNTIVVFLLLHLLVYPSSNGYNSYMDKDETPIGGIRKPLQPTKQLFYTTILMDILSILIAFIINTILSLGILFYIIASRAYSYRGIRLKKYPIIGFITVFLLQGALIFIIVYSACGETGLAHIPLFPPLISSLLIGASYPLTQIYQHDEDKKDGVITISYLLGKRGSFIFSSVLFISATILLFYFFQNLNQLEAFYRYLFFTAPMVLFFCYWMVRVWNDEQQANYKNSLRMNLISTICTSTFFIYLIINRHFE